MSNGKVCGRWPGSDVSTRRSAETVAVTAANGPGLGFLGGCGPARHAGEGSPKRHGSDHRGRIVVFAWLPLLLLAACSDTVAPPEEFGGRVVVYEGGGDGPIKPEPPLDPEPEPEVPGTMELYARGAFTPLVDGTCYVEVRGTPQGGYIDAVRIVVQPQVLGESVSPPVYFPGAYILPGQRWRLRETFATTGPTDFNVALELRDGGVITYRRLCR